MGWLVEISADGLGLVSPGGGRRLEAGEIWVAWFDLPVSPGLAAVVEVRTVVESGDNLRLGCRIRGDLTEGSGRLHEALDAYIGGVRLAS